MLDFACHWCLIFLSGFLGFQYLYIFFMNIKKAKKLILRIPITLKIENRVVWEAPYSTVYVKHIKSILCRVEHRADAFFRTNLLCPFFNWNRVTQFTLGCKTHHNTWLVDSSHHSQLTLSLTHTLSLSHSPTPPPPPAPKKK